MGSQATDQLSRAVFQIPNEIQDYQNRLLDLIEQVHGSRNARHEAVFDCINMLEGNIVSRLCQRTDLEPEHIDLLLDMSPQEYAYQAKNIVDEILTIRSMIRDRSNGAAIPTILLLPAKIFDKISEDLKRDIIKPRIHITGIRVYRQSTMENAAIVVCNSKFKVPKQDLVYRIDILQR